MSYAARLGVKGRSLRWLTVIGAAAVAVGSLIGLGRLDIASVFVGTLLVASSIGRLSLRGWLTAVLIAAVIPRIFSVYLGLPTALDFLHYPIVWLFVIVSLVRRPTVASEAPRRWLAGLVVLSLTSVIVNLGNPLRLILFFAIFAEPLLLLWGISRWSPSKKEISAIMKVIAAILLIQLPIGLVQGLTIGWQDSVQGTLVGHGAGHHVLGALFALGLMVAIAAFRSRRITLLALLMAAVSSFGMMVATGSTQVVIAASVALLLIQLAPWVARRTSGRASGLAPVMTFVLIVVFAFAGLASATRLLPGVEERVRRIVVEERPAEFQLLQERLDEPLGLILGSGPGTTASRASLLLTPAQLKETSPLKILNLAPTELGIRFSTETVSAYGGSAESAASSALGVIGDLGLLGFVVLMMFFLAAWRRARSASSWLAYSVQASILLIAILMFVDNWLEYPEFTLPLAILWSLALTPTRSESLA